MWNTTSTYPEMWPFQVISISISNDKQQNSKHGLTPPKTASKEQHGFNLFTKHCAVCHSLFYQSVSGKAPDLGYVTRYLSDGTISNRINNGFFVMPPFKAILNKVDIADIIAYLKWVAQSDVPKALTQKK